MSIKVPKYPDLNMLLQEDKESKQFYDKLPDYVKDQINQRPQNINSFSSLKDYAENLLRGDD